MCPFKIAATPDIIGNLKSRILGSTFVIRSCCSASAVATPSVVSLVARIFSRVSPLARRTPTSLSLGKLGKALVKKFQGIEQFVIPGARSMRAQHFGDFFRTYF